ncbi:hypothetical protein [Hyphobacterium sp.]|uniref:hypothetical protein n=1 Tax=Hyphobacterium sp. TaxID=2004662 RepID=UPI00374A0FB3
MFDVKGSIQQPADDVGNDLSGVSSHTEYQVKMPARGKPLPRRIYELVCDDLDAMGLESVINHYSRSRQFYSDDVDFCVVQENEYRHCQIVFSDHYIEEMANHIDGGVMSAINLCNRRQWRIVKPQLRYISKALVGIDDYRLSIKAAENICEADPADIDEMMPEEYLV